MAVRVDKGVGFCVMKKEYMRRNWKHYHRQNILVMTDSVILEIERDINKKLLALKKKERG